MRALNAAAAAIVLCTALVGGCQPDEPAGEPATLATPSVGPTADTSPSPEPTQPPTPSAPNPTPDPFAVPATIDAAYVERVLNALYEIDAETTRLALEAGTVTPQVRERIEAGNAPEEAEIQSTLLEAALATGLPEVRRTPGPVTITVSRVLSATPTCVALVGTTDYSNVLVEPPVGPQEPQLIALVPEEPDTAINPTPWKIGRSQIVDDSGEVDLCAL